MFQSWTNPKATLEFDSAESPKPNHVGVVEFSKSILAKQRMFFKGKNNHGFSRCNWVSDDPKLSILVRDWNWIYSRWQILLIDTNWTIIVQTLTYILAWNHTKAKEINSWVVGRAYNIQYIAKVEIRQRPREELKARPGYFAGWCVFTELQVFSGYVWTGVYPINAK